MLCTLEICPLREQSERAGKIPPPALSLVEGYEGGDDKRLSSRGSITILKICDKKSS